MKRTGLFVVYLVIFLDMLGFGVLIPVIRDLTQYLVKQSGLTWPSPEIYMGILMAVYSGSQMISSPLLGRFSDVFGRKKVFLFSAIGNLASYVVWIFSGSYWPFLAGRILSGITGGNIAIAQSILADNTTPEQRPRAMGLLGASIGMGFVFGPFLGVLMIKIGPLFGGLIESNPYWMIGLPPLFFAGVAVALISISHFAKSPAAEQGERAFAFSAVAASFKSNGGRPVYKTQLLSQIAFVSFEVLFAWILQHQYNFDLKDTYYFFGFQGVLLAVVQGGIYRRVEKRKPPEYWVRMGLLLSFVTLAALPWVGYLPAATIAGVSIKLIVLWLMLAVLTVALGFGTPSLNAYASIHAPRNEQGQTMGNMQGLAAFARFSAPLLATSLYAVWLPLPFAVAGLSCLLAWWLFSKD